MPRLNLDLGDRGCLEVGLEEEANGKAFLADFALGGGGDNLKLLWLLVCGALKRGGAEQPHVIGLLQVIHQVGDKPLRRQYPGGTVFQGDDDEKAAANA